MKIASLRDKTQPVICVSFLLKLGRFADSHIKKSEPKSVRIFILKNSILFLNNFQRFCRNRNFFHRFINLAWRVRCH